MNVLHTQFSQISGTRRSKIVEERDMAQEGGEVEGEVSNSVSSNV